MSRRSNLCLVGLALALDASSQGIYGVTRRSTTLEKQATARRFFDAAGMNVVGASPATPGTPPAMSPTLAATPSSPAARQAVTVAPNPMAPRTAQPLALQKPNIPGASLATTTTSTNRGVPHLPKKPTPAPLARPGNR